MLKFSHNVLEQIVAADIAQRGSHGPSVHVTKAMAAEISQIAEILPATPLAVEINHAAQRSDVIPLPQISDLVALSAAPAFVAVAAELEVGNDGDVQHQAHASANAASVAPVLPPASSAIDGVHVPTAEAVAALGDSETNPVLKTLQQLQVVNKSI